MGSGALLTSIMVGDFNLPNIDWSSGEARGREAKFVTVLQDNYMEQLVDFKTHIKGNCLDLLITNIPGKVKEVCEMGRLGKSDHIIIHHADKPGPGGTERE